MTVFSPTVNMLTAAYIVDTLSSVRYEPRLNHMFSRCPKIGQLRSACGQLSISSDPRSRARAHTRNSGGVRRRVFHNGYAR
jgi:hypothetical protein